MQLTADKTPLRFYEPSEYSRGSFFGLLVVLFVLVFVTMKLPNPIWRAIGYGGVAVMLTGICFHGYRFQVLGDAKEIRITTCWMYLLAGKARTYQLSSVTEIRKVETTDDATCFYRITFSDGRNFNIYSQRNGERLAQAIDALK